MRPMVGRPADMFNQNCQTYAGFQSKLHSVKRMHPSGYRDGSDPAFLKDLKELPPLHPAEVENVLCEKERVAPPKVEPIFPPPTDPSCTIAAPMANKNLDQRLRKGSVSYHPLAGPSTLNLGTIPRMSTMATTPVTVTDSSYPYMDLRAKYDPNCYTGMQSTYDHFDLPGFTPDSNSFNAYARSSGYASWASLGKYDQIVPNRVAPSTVTALPIADGLSGYRNYSTSSTSLESSPNFATSAGVPFGNSFQNETFVQSMQSYSGALDPQQSAYGMNLSVYNYTSQPPLPPAPQPPNTTSYM